MSGFVPLLFPLVLSVLGAALFETVSAEKASRFEHGNFVTHKNRALNVTNITAWVVVSDELECLFACITTPPCLSVNLASLGGGEDQSLKCDLLATDKYAHPEKLLESQQTHHYSKYSKCEKNPCLNNNPCVPNYEDNDYKCDCRRPYEGTHCERTVIRNCADVYAHGSTSSGVYSVQPDALGSFDVYCDHDTAAGGWTVVQKRVNGSVDFYRGWEEYKKGFGELSGEFWLGLDKIHRLTGQTDNRLRVDLVDNDGNTGYAEYGTFTVADEASKYKLTVTGYSGTIGHSLAIHDGMYFSTFDRDNDRGASENCAAHWHGAWWYARCHNANLNGNYQPGVQGANGMVWLHWKGIHLGLKASQIKIRPTSF